MKLVCVNVDVPEETTRFLMEACAARDVEYEEIDAPTFDFAPDRRLMPGTLLFRPAVATSAQRVEQFLYADGVATFYRTADSMFADISASPLLFQRGGLPVPRTIYLASTDRALLDAHVERVGGYPVVVKTLGGEGGVGVLLVESRRSLYGVVDHLVHGGANPLLCAYVPDAIHWRVVVVGERAVAAYRNPLEAGDFRTYASEDPEDYLADVPAEMARIAVEAVRLVGTEFGGVDLLEHESGRLYVLEANYPCYFPQAQEVGRIDIAGAMVEHLMGKSRRLASDGARGSA